MKEHPSTTQNVPEEDLGNPNDDGCVLGTAGRDEDPNATTDWDHGPDSAGNVPTVNDAHARGQVEKSRADDFEVVQGDDALD